MARFQSRFDVATSPEAAFAYLSDPLNRAEWDSSIRTVTPLDDAGGATGDRYDMVVGFYGRAIDTVLEIAELDSPHRIVFVTSGRVAGRDCIEIEATAAGTSIGLDLSVQMKGAARVLDRGLQVAFAGIGENAVAGVQRRLDGARR